MKNTPGVVHRREFLGTIAGGISAIGLSGLIQSRSFAESAPALKEADAQGFKTWLDKIKGTHKIVFDAPMPLKGDVFVWARVFHMTSKQIGIEDNDRTAVVILRHDAIPYAMHDPLWAKYKFGENFNITDAATKAPAIRNPFYKPKEGELELPGMAIEDLTASGVLFGVCDLALSFYSKGIADKMKMDGTEIKKEWVAGILPGIHVVPSGVLAVHHAQMRGCTYSFAGAG